MDYWRRIEFGIFPIPYAADLESIRSAVRLADQEGLDLVGIQDHPYQRRFLDAYALITALAADTESIRFFADVTNLPMRPPAMLAKTAASIDILSGGRFELGLGAGSFWEAIHAMGGPVHTPGQALLALSEAIDVIRLMWSNERSVSYDGEHYRLSGVKPGPAPAHDIQIWLGVGGPRALRLLGAKADGWLPSLPRTAIDSLVERQAAIDDAARSAGRSPAAIRRLANVKGIITDGPTEGFLRGPEDQWRDELVDLALNHGIDSFILWSEGDPAEQIARFARIADQVRDDVASSRADST